MTNMSLKVGPVRDLVLLMGGLALLAHETLVVESPRELLLLLVAAMLGLPATLKTDKLFQKSSSPEDPPSPPT